MLVDKLDSRTPIRRWASTNFGAAVVREMLGVADIAAMFGVEPKTVSMWRLRYPDFPEPDVVIGESTGRCSSSRDDPQPGLRDRFREPDDRRAQRP
jgi:hypothetical protein